LVKNQQVKQNICIILFFYKMDRKYKTSSKFKNENSMKEELSVPFLLMKYEYAVLNNIMVDGKILYVKAVNPDCNTVYIKIDTDNYNVSSELDIETEEINAELIPENIILDLVDCIGYEVCGAAFDCKDGICVTNTSDDGTVTKKFFKTKETFGTDTIMGYPIIKLSELKAYPEKINDYVDVSTRRIRNQLVEKSHKEFDTLFVLFTENYEKIKEYNYILDDVFFRMKEKIENLEEENFDFPKVTLDNYKEKHELQKNLSDLNNKVVQYATEIKKINLLTESMKILGNELDLSIINLKNMKI